MSARDILMELRDVRENLSHSATFDEIGSNAYQLLQEILNGAVASFGAAVVLIEKDLKKGDGDV